VAEKLLKESEVAQWLGVSPRTIQGWRQRRKGPPHVVVSSRLIRYREDEILKWLNELPRESGNQT
jgi:predicted DNA-binding transcriptional regulator AlpA